MNRKKAEGCVGYFCLLLAMCVVLALPNWLGLADISPWIILAPLWVPGAFALLVLVLVLAMLVYEEYKGRRPK